MVPLKDPWLAAFLALLIPGLGHLYQGRLFKAVLFGVCILGTYFCGMSLGEGRPVYMHYYSGPPHIAHEYPQNFTNTGRYFNYGYLAQSLVGLPSLPAYFQSGRILPSQGNQFGSDFAQGLQGTVEGILIPPEEQENVVAFVGQVKLDYDPQQDRFTGLVNASTANGEQLELSISQTAYDTQHIDLPRMAEPSRPLLATINQSSNEKFNDWVMKSEMSRSFWDWYQMPLHDRQLNDLHGRLGKTWELAMVLTWIAGLLNVFVIWDAFEGPAHLQLIEQEEKPSTPKSPQPATK